jgi:hypothetical protein
MSALLLTNLVTQDVFKLGCEWLRYATSYCHGHIPFFRRSFAYFIHASNIIQQGPDEHGQTESSIFIRILGNDVYRIAKMKLKTWLDVGDDQNDVCDLGGWYNPHHRAWG